MGMILSPKGFLQVGGAVLLLVGILGFVGVIGPDAQSSIFGDFWWFDMAENVAHTVLGIVAIGAAFVLPSNLQKTLVMLVGVFALLVGVYSAVFSSMLLGANLENPADTILHLLVGVWALAAAMMKPGMERPGGMV